MDKWTRLPTKETIDETIAALKANGINTFNVLDGKKAKEEVLKLIPEGAEVMNMTSVTLDTIGLPYEINESGKYNSIRNKLNNMDRATQGLEMQKLGAGSAWVIGSVHAVTEDGYVIIASNTGSQLAAYVADAAHVIWVVGAQKIVKNTDEGIRRIYEYVLPLESDRINKAYNLTTGSYVSKLLIINREIKPQRLTLILVNERLGF